MMDSDTFLCTLYVMADDFCKDHLPPEKTPGATASLTRGEVVTLALFGQWSCFLSERGFYRYASRHLRPAFPTMPSRGQFNRLMRRHYGTIAAFFRHLVALLQSQNCPYEALDSTGVPTRDAKRRGLVGWRVRRTSAGATAWDGMKGSICWSR